MGPTSKDLLGLECNDCASPLETRLLLCNGTANVSHTKKDAPSGISSDKLITTCVPESSVEIHLRPKRCFGLYGNTTVLGKLKDFLPVMDEANRNLHVELQETIKDYDIEVLRGDEEQYIEMDLALGVADLHTPEALAAAESAMAGQWQTLPLSAISDDSDSSWATDDDIGDDNDNSDGSACGQMSQRETSAIGRKGHKRPKIEELQ